MQTAAAIESVVVNRDGSTWQVYGGHGGAIPEGVLTDGAHTLRNAQRWQTGAVGEGELTDGGNAPGNGNGGDLRTISEGIRSDGGSPVFHYHSGYLIFMGIPSRSIAEAVEVIHFPAAGDGEQTIAGEQIGQVGAAVAGSEDGCRGGSQGTEVIEQGSEGGLCIGNQGLLGFGQGIVGIIGFLHLGINLRLLLSGHGHDFLQGGEGFDQGADGLHGFVHFGLGGLRGILFGFGGVFTRFGALRAGIGARLLRGGRNVAAGTVVGMGTDQLPGHAPAFRRAGVAAGNLCHGLHIAAAIGMYGLAVLVRLAFTVLSFHSRNIATFAVGMDALCHRLIAFIRVRMTAVVPLHSSGITARLRVLRVVCT